MKRLGDSINQVDQVLSNLDTATRPIAQHSASVVKNLDESSAELNKTLREFGDLLRTFNQGEGTVRRFLTDPSLYVSLTDAVNQLTHVLPRVDRILRDVEVFADKIARHPESLGVSGAIRPSKGLKEAPTSMEGWSAGPGH
jgi:phospholipid/cholesterol/gamma-HCH transport system substrate-binding protein